MPNQPKTQARSVRIPDELWDVISAIAANTSTNASGVIREAISAHFDANYTTQINPTIAMTKGASTLVACPNCGCLAYITERVTKPSTLHPCPQCQAQRWVRTDLEGPFKPLGFVDAGDEY